MWNTTTALNTTEMSPTGSQAPEWVELIPAGEVIGRDGRRWLNNNPFAVVQAFIAGNMDLPVDLEHATELKGSQGEPAPAVGWVKELKVMDGAVWGRVAWNQTGVQLIATRQYRYLSPVILYQKDTGAIAGLTSVALTNRPNLNLRALNRHGEGGGQAGAARTLSADERAVCARLGISEGAYSNTAPGNGSSGRGSALASALSADEQLVCQRMGITEADYLRTAI